MENVMTNGFAELSVNEMDEINGGGWSDVFEKVSPIGVAEFIYQLGQDFGAGSVKFGREIYDTYRDVKKIFS